MTSSTPLGSGFGIRNAMPFMPINNRRWTIGRKVPPTSDRRPGEERVGRRRRGKSHKVRGMEYSVRSNSGSESREEDGRAGQTTSQPTDQRDKTVQSTHLGISQGQKPQERPPIEIDPARFLPNVDNLDRAAIPNKTSQVDEVLASPNRT